MKTLSILLATAFLASCASHKPTTTYLTPQYKHAIFQAKTIDDDCARNVRYKKIAAQYLKANKDKKGVIIYRDRLKGAIRHLIVDRDKKKLQGFISKSDKLCKYATLKIKFGMSLAPEKECKYAINKPYYKTCLAEGKKQERQRQVRQARLERQRQERQRQERQAYSYFSVDEVLKKARDNNIRRLYASQQCSHLLGHKYYDSYRNCMERYSQAKPLY